MQISPSVSDNYFNIVKSWSARNQKVDGKNTILDGIDNDTGEQFGSLMEFGLREQLGHPFALKRESHYSPIRRGGCSG